MASRTIIFLLLAVTAFQGLNADTLLKRNIIDNFINSTKSQIDEANQFAKSIAQFIKQHVKQEEQKIADRISEATDFIKNSFNQNTTSEKRSPNLFTDLFQQVVNNYTSSLNSSFGKRSFNFFPDISDLFQQGVSNFTSLFNSSFGKRSPTLFDNMEKLFNNYSSLAMSQFGKRSPNFFTDISDLFQQELNNLTSSSNSSFGKRSFLFFDQILNRNSSSNKSFISEFINKTKENAEHAKEKIQEFVHETQQKFEDFFKRISQHGQNTTVASKRSITIDSGLAILNDLRSKLETVVQNIKQHLESANSTSFIDNLKNIASDIVGTRFNFTEIREDVSECVSAEENNVTAELEQAKTQLEAIYSKDKTAAEPFLKEVSVTAPKVANLIFATSVNASMCGQYNVVCLAGVAYNAYTQAVVLEPEVAQEIQEGVALAKTLAADAKAIQEQIFAPAFSEMKAIAEETISCIEGKINA